VTSESPVAAVVRVFYALVPPPSLQAALAVIGRDLARRAHGRPVPAPNIHLTLAFVGAWPIARLPALTSAGASLNAPPFAMPLDVQGGFRRAGVAWVGATASPPALLGLAGSLHTALSAAGITLDARPLYPHLTLARKCRGPYPDEPIGPLRWDVDTVSLMLSDTRAEGARYATLAQWPLGHRGMA